MRCDSMRENPLALGDVPECGIQRNVSMTDGSMGHGQFRGSFVDDTGIIHIIMLNELKTSRVWVFNRSENRYV